MNVPKALGTVSLRFIEPPHPWLEFRLCQHPNRDRTLGPVLPDPLSLVGNGPIIKTIFACLDCVHERDGSLTTL